MLEVDQKIEYRNISLKELFAQLQKFKKVSFSGSLDLKVDNGESCIFFFRLGYLSLPGGSNLENRWYRHLRLLARNLKKPQLQYLALEQDLQRQYATLAKLLSQGLIERQQLARLIASFTAEMLFDLIQLCQIGGHRLSYRVIPVDPTNKFISLLPLVEVTSILKQAVESWQKWQNEGLANYSPNLFPIIQQPNLLQAQSLPSTQASIISLIDGCSNLRDLAVTSNSEIVTLTKSLLPLVALGAIQFSPVPISQKSDTAEVGKKTPLVTYPEQETLIACVDDSPVVCQVLGRIIREQGYGFTCIQEPLRAIPLFLKRKPDLIFLDLMMPISNGYELCAQIRRTPSLKNVPVVILTGKDGLVDRIRAKVVGSTDFISKPVRAEEVLKMLRKHLSVKIRNKNE